MPNSPFFRWPGIYILVCALMVTLSGCHRVAAVVDWRVVRIGPGPQGNTFVVPYQPQIQQVVLTPARPSLTVTAMSPFIAASDTTHADSIYKLLTNINDHTRLRRHASCWFILRLINTTSLTHWVIRSIDEHRDPRLFMDGPGVGDSLREIERIAVPWPQNNRFREYIFPFEMKTWQSRELLLNVKNEDVPFTNEFRLYPYSGSWYEPADTQLMAGLVTGATILFCVILIYFFALSRDPVFPLFLIWLVIFVLRYLTYTYLTVSHFMGFRTFDELVSILSGRGLIVLIPFWRFRPTRRLAAYIVCVVLSLLLYYSHWLFRLNFGSGYSGLADILMVLAFIYYCTDPVLTENRRPHWELLMAMPVALKLWQVAAERSIGLFNAYNTPILELVFFAIVTILRFRQFRRKKQKLLLQQAIATEKEVSKTVIGTLENERNRISQDIHDELGGSLAVLKLKILSLTKNAEQLELVMKVIDKAADSVRSISHRLMPPHFAETNLDTLLNEHFASLNETGPMRFQFVSIGIPHGFSKDEELMIYRVIMELVHNCLKHSRANQVIVQLIYTDNQLGILCEDDGVGFSTSLDAGIGLKSIRSRVMYLNGTINIDSSRNGTTVIITIPIRAIPDSR